MSSIRSLARDAEERLELATAVDVPYREGMLRVVRPEETIAFKLKFASEQDPADARSILVRQAGKLDERRLDALARRLGVLSSLAAVRAEIQRSR